LHALGANPQRSLASAHAPQGSGSSADSASSAQAKARQPKATAQSNTPQRPSSTSVFPEGNTANMGATVTPVYVELSSKLTRVSALCSRGSRFRAQQSKRHRPEIPNSAVCG
jgi:hypothetical protein